MTNEREAATSAVIVVADDSRLFRSALRMALNERPGCRVVAEAGDVSTMLSATATHRPDVLLTAVDLPGPLTLLDVLGAVAERSPTTAVLVVVGRDQAGLLDALEGGALGCVSRHGSVDDVHAAISTVLCGNAYVPPPLLTGLLRNLIDRRREQAAAEERYRRLSRREREVLALLGEGLGHTDIAGRLVISPQTARTHVQNVLSKLGVHSRIEAANFALHHGFSGTG